MPRKKLTLTEEDKKTILDENYFYEYGMNPAFKNLVELAR